MTSLAITSTPPHWDWRRLDELCSGIFDCPHSTPKLAESGPYLARTPDIGSGVFRPETASHVSLETYHERITRAEPRFGDLLYSREGTYFGVAAEVPPNTIVCLGQRMVLIRPTADLVDHRYLRYWLNSPSMFAHVAAHKDGSVAQRLNLPTIRSIPIPLPSLDEQRCIADTCGALDDKVESNRRAVDLIEHLLAVQFQHLIASNDVDNVLLSEIASFTKGISYKSVDLLPSRTSLVTLKSFDRTGGYKPDGLKPYVGPYKPQQVIEPGEVVVAQTDLTQGAEVVGRAVRVPSDPSADMLVASLDLVIVRPAPDISREYLLGVLAHEAFRQYCRSRTSGTTVLHLASDAIPTYPAPVASAAARQDYSEMSRPLIERLDSLNAENLKLASLRDALLLGLLSGQVRVPGPDPVGAAA